jgi:hypothetical protein
MTPTTLTGDPEYDGDRTANTREKELYYVKDVISSTKKILAIEKAIKKYN